MPRNINELTQSTTKSMALNSPEDKENVTIKSVNPLKNSEKGLETFSKSHFYKIITKEGSQLKSINIYDNKEDISSAISSAKGINALSDEVKSKAISASKLLEASISLNILNDPGLIGDVIDSNTKKLSSTLSELLVNGTEVLWNKAKMPIKDVFTKQYDSQMKSNGDQIGRQPQNIGEKDKIDFNWLHGQLNTPLRYVQESERHRYMLTKIKALSIFGTTVWQLMNQPDEFDLRTLDLPKDDGKFNNNEEILNILFTNGKNNFQENYKSFTSKTRTKLFDDPLTRARSERMPLILKDGSTNDYQVVDGEYESAAVYNLGFGQVIQKSKNPEEQAALTEALNTKGVNGIKRDGAPILDLTRPYMMSETEITPETLEKEFPGFETLPEEINKQRLHHGTGINRWQPFGEYAADTIERGMPIAGAQSGGTCDILLASTILNGDLYGKEDKVIPLTMGTAAFMNYGGYHTFNEVLPIGEAMSMGEKGRPFIPSNQAKIFDRDLYSSMVAKVKHYAGETAQKNTSKYKVAYDRIIDKLKMVDPNILNLDKYDMTFYAK